MQKRGMNLLDAMNAEGGNGEAVLSNVLGTAPILARETDTEHAMLARVLQGVIYIAGHPAGGNAERDIAGLREQAELLGEGLGKIAVVADCGEQDRIVH